VAKVITINYEEHTVTLRTVLGEDQEFQRAPVAMSYPGAGRRHFFGAMPEEGDYCVIGHLSQESDGRTTTPVILGWVLPGTWMGHDWMVGQSFAPDEYSMDPKDRFFVSGAFERVRHKLRHIDPGNVLASSSQGADMVLNEEVLLTNRRGNEIRLRDPDQALVFRALQRFDVLAGTRTYSGMVQRDATFLPTQMVADGIPWDGPSQFNSAENRPYTDEELRTLSGGGTVGNLLPNQVFERRQGDGTLGDRASGVLFEPSTDPYEFLKRGLFVTDDGRMFDEAHQSEAVYGGKSFFRVGTATESDGTPVNAAVGIGDQGRAYTEHRVEVSHTADGRLPVSEQTEDFDADRLPRTRQTEADEFGRSSSAPFIEHVFGTVVGNDPFSPSGRLKYGLPLMPVIFDDAGGPAPSMESAIGEPVENHAASLFRMFPPTPTGGPPTFWSVAKDGRVFMSVGGPQNQKYSAEVAMKSGLRLNLGGALRLELERGLEMRVGNGDPVENLGLNLASDNGAVRVYGGGNTTSGALGTRSAPTDGGEADLPSLLLEGRNNVTIRSSRKVITNSNVVETRAQSIASKALAGIDLTAGERINVNSKTYDQITNGKATYHYHGPKDNLPTNGAFRETTFTGIGTSVVDKYTVVQGDREETFLIGNHSTTVRVGNLTYETNAGKWKAKAGANELSVDVTDGMKADILVGNISMNAVAGAVCISGLVSATVKSLATATLSGTTGGVVLGGPGKIGGIVSASDLDPLTGLPLGAFGMGSPGHFLSTPV
jgi:hypothetical protein